MGSIPVFGKKHIFKGLPWLGFEIDESKGKGSHAKATHPTKKPDPQRQRPYIIIPNRDEFGDPGFRKDFIKEVCAFGFTEEEVVLVLRGKKPRVK